jgi:hypothetical protein
VPILQLGFIQSENASPDLPYDLTHGLPERIVFPDSRSVGTLFLVKNRTDFRLDDFKSETGTGQRAIEKDAYLLWRLSERYDERPFVVGLLDADRVKRLWQLRAVEFQDAARGDTINSQSRMTIQWGRMRLQEHLERLLANASRKRT